MHLVKPRIRSSTPGGLKVPAIISSLLVLPFTILELVNGRDSTDGFPIVLFGLMWLLPFAFVAILMPLLRAARTGDRNVQSALSLLPKIVLLMLFAWLWVGLTLDQMPCFLGAPNCD